MKIGSLFSGYGGLEQGVQSVLGGTVAWHSEIDPGACKILAHRYPDVPNLGDITAVDWASVEPVDVLTGGFPCQDVSAAGKRRGLNDNTRSGLWAQMVRAIDELRPPLVVAENVRGLLSACALSELEPCPRCLGDESQPHRPVLRALGRVVGDLSDLGYVGRWGGLRAADVGAPHGRFRVFVVAWPAADTERGGRDWRARESVGRSIVGATASRDRADVAADPDRLGLERGRRARDGRSGPADGAVASAHPESDGRYEGRPEPARLVRGSDDAVGGDQTVCTTCGDPVDFHDGDGFCAGACGGSCADPWFGRPVAAADSHGRGLPRLEAVDGTEPTVGRGHADGLGVEAGRLDWGQFEPAVRRWERCLGRPAPSPTETGAKGQPRLSPAFVEWMMGLPAGWVTDVPGLGRNEQLKALGNGVVSQQAAQALRLLLPDVVAGAA